MHHKSHIKHTKLGWEEVPGVDPGHGRGVQGSGQRGEGLVAPGPGAGELTWTLSSVTIINISGTHSLGPV